MSRARAEAAALLFTLLFMGFGLGCASRLQKTYEPLGGEWQPGVGWRPATQAAEAPRSAQPGSAQEKLRSESKKAFEAEAYDDALRGFLVLRDLRPAREAAEPLPGEPAPPPLEARAAASAAGNPLAAGKAEPRPEGQPAVDAAGRAVVPGTRGAGGRGGRNAEVAFYIAECHYRQGEAQYERAYPYYLEVLEADPTEEILKATLGRIYDLGRAFLDGRAKRTFLGVSYRSPSYGVEILLGEKGLVTNYPFLAFSEDALMEVARYYFDTGAYAEAEHVFDRLVRDYPQSTWHETAEYQLAVAIFRQVRGVEYDQEALRKARSKFNLYLNHYPRGSRVDEARRFLREIAEMEGMHDLRIAKYYLRESQPKAAMLYLNSVMFNNPKTEAAREAREIYENMEKRRAGQ